MNSSRTEYDRMMAEKYNPIREGYNSAPWPGSRSKFDSDMQNTFCPSCPYRSIENYGQDKPTSYRTKYDMELQKVYGSAALGDKAYGNSLYKAGYYGKTPSYKENFADNGAYENSFYRAGFYGSGTPTWENYVQSPNLYEDPDLAGSYTLFNR